MDFAAAAAAAAELWLPARRALCARGAVRAGRALSTTSRPVARCLHGPVAGRLRRRRGRLRRRARRAVAGPGAALQGTRRAQFIAAAGSLRRRLPAPKRGPATTAAAAALVRAARRRLFTFGHGNVSAVRARGRSLDSRRLAAAVFVHAHAVHVQPRRGFNVFSAGMGPRGAPPARRPPIAAAAAAGAARLVRRRLWAAAADDGPLCATFDGPVLSARGSVRASGIRPVCAGPADDGPVRAAAAAGRRVWGAATRRRLWATRVRATHGRGPPRRFREARAIGGPRHPRGLAARGGARLPRRRRRLTPKHAPRHGMTR
mmetsp:Transcript_5528/g.19992  ORF Transcript_5528/g.19992 Transcript_5528/m.19992 type:complete len:317 (+) Transcript_5528:2322-3272(+)